MSTAISARAWQRPTLNIDLTRSHGAYAYDLTTQREVLDLFGMFSSLPLGYNHPAFDTVEFNAEVQWYAGAKLALGTVDCPAAAEFRDTFKRLAHTSQHPYHFFTNTGSQAVEAALKACFEKCAYGRNSQYIAINRSFHGVYGYAVSAACVCDDEPWVRVRDLPALVECRRFDAIEMKPTYTLDRIEDWLVRQPVAAVLVEPIQCSAGDIVIDPAFLRELCDVCTRTGTPLVFDEIQTGFGVTGSFWYWQKLGIVPDVVVFGKKAQVSGFMSHFAFDARKLASTWQGDVIDMLRCTQVLEEYESGYVLTNAAAQGGEIEYILRAVGLIVRRVGLLIAIDFDSIYDRDDWCRRMWDAGVLVNPTGERCVRLRPPLNIDDATISDLTARLNEAASRRVVLPAFAP